MKMTSKFKFESKYLLPMRVIYTHNGSVLMNPTISTQSYSMVDTTLVAQQPGVHLPCPPNVFSPALGVEDLYENILFYLDAVILEADLEERDPKVYIATGDNFEELLTFSFKEGVRDEKPDVFYPDVAISSTEFAIVGNLYEPFSVIKERIRTVQSGKATKRLLTQETVQDFLKKRS